MSENKEKDWIGKLSIRETDNTSNEAKGNRNGLDKWN